MPSVIHVQLIWPQSGEVTPVEIQVVPDQGPPLPDLALEDTVPPYEIDGLVLESDRTLVSSLADWARLLPEQGSDVVHARCLRSRAPTVVRYLDPANTGVRPIQVHVPAGP